MSVDYEMARFDWCRVHTYLGYAEMVPGALRGVVADLDRVEVKWLGVGIWRILLSVAGPCEGCAPVGRGSAWDDAAGAGRGA